MQTATGKHVLLWQADDSDWDTFSDPYGYHAHALWHIKTPYSTIASRMNSSAEAEVDLHYASDNNVHYVFVPEGSQSAVTAWGAKPLNYSNASGLASRVDNGTEVPWYSTKRITYELQDVADIFPTQWVGNPWYVRWTTNDWAYVLLESPILNEAGQPEVSAGMQLFYLRSRDIGKSGGVGADAAVLGKKPIWGTLLGRIELGSPLETRTSSAGSRGSGTTATGEPAGRPAATTTRTTPTGGSTTSSSTRASSPATRRTTRPGRGSRARGTRRPTAGSTGAGCSSSTTGPATRRPRPRPSSAPRPPSNSAASRAARGTPRRAPVKLYVRAVRSLET